MSPEALSPEAQVLIDDLAQRHGFSHDAIAHMLLALQQGNGAMAMFSHTEFGGPGQWMRGGLLMLSDTLNYPLKHRVDALCHEISDWLDTAALFADDTPPASLQGATSTHGNWWPAGLGLPTATGEQNGLRYAYFDTAGRLAVEHGGVLVVYDTLDHCIQGVASARQDGNNAITFTSQHGVMDLALLPVISSVGQAEPPEASRREAALLDAIERLGELKERGLLTDEEFTRKKAELLDRL